MKAKALSTGHYTVRCFDKNGKLKWEDEIDNLVVNDGLDYLLDAGLANGTQITVWYVGLTDGAPVTTAAGDTMAVHAGWSEDVTYSDGTRQTWTAGTVASQSVDNSAATADFAMNGTTTIGGAFLTSDSAKSGISGTLYSVGAFSGGDKGVDSGDTLQVTATFTEAAA